MDNKTLVSNIKKLCQERQIPISQLEKDLYMSPGLISRWTKNVPAIDRIVEIAEYFDISIDSLIKDPSVSHSDMKSAQRLISALYQQTIEAVISWEILDIRQPIDGIPTDIPPISKYSADSDLFYCPFQQGFFLLAAHYTKNIQPELALYILPDTRSYPEHVCSDYSRLARLYEYLVRRLAHQLNALKTEQFITDFLESTHAPDESGDNLAIEKITPLKLVSNNSPN